MRWSVYKVVRHGTVRELVGLGYVIADSKPLALAAAWRRWPQLIDKSQRQDGFSVQPYVDDPMGLGKKARRTVHAHPSGGDRHGE